MLLISQLSYCSQSNRLDIQRVYKLDELAEKLNKAEWNSEEFLKCNELGFSGCITGLSLLALIGCMKPVVAGVGVAASGAACYVNRKALNNERKTHESATATREVMDELINYTKKEMDEYYSKRVTYDTLFWSAQTKNKNTDLVHFYDEKISKDMK